MIAHNISEVTVVMDTDPFGSLGPILEWTPIDLASGSFRFEENPGASSVKISGTRQMIAHTTSTQPSTNARSGGEPCSGLSIIDSLHLIVCIDLVTDLSTLCK